MAQDMSLKIRIPLMFWHTDGERQLWDPELVTEGLEQIHEVREDKPKPAESNRGGLQVAMRMKMMGGGPFTLEELCTTFDSKPAVLLKQLEAGVRNGHIQDHGDEWAVPRSK